jgi:hypothetical protein
VFRTVLSYFLAQLFDLFSQLIARILHPTDGCVCLLLPLEPRTMLLPYVSYICSLCVQVLHYFCAKRIQLLEVFTDLILTGEHLLAPVAQLCETII